MSGRQVHCRARCTCKVTRAANLWLAQRAWVPEGKQASQLVRVLPFLPYLTCSALVLPWRPTTPTADLSSSCGLASNLPAPCTQEFRPPQDLQLPPEPSAEALLKQQSYPARTAAGQYWSAGGHLPREPFQVVPGNGSTGKAPECTLAKPRLGGTAKVMVQLQRLQVPLYSSIDSACTVLHERPRCPCTQALTQPALCCMNGAACVTAWGPAHLQ